MVIALQLTPICPFSWMALTIDLAVVLTAHMFVPWRRQDSLLIVPQWAVLSELTSQLMTLNAGLWLKNIVGSQRGYERCHLFHTHLALSLFLFPSLSLSCLDKVKSPLFCYRIHELKSG